MAKHFTKDEKLIIIEYSKTNSSVETVKKFDINLSTLKRWKREVKKFGEDSLEWGNGSNTKPIQQKKIEKNKNFKKNNQNYESMTRNELIERAKFGAALKKYSIKSIKDKFFIIDTQKANCKIGFLCSMLEISAFGHYKWKKNGSPLYNKWNNNLAEKLAIFIMVSIKFMVIIWFQCFYLKFIKLIFFLMLFIVIWKIWK